MAFVYNNTTIDDSCDCSSCPVSVFTKNVGKALQQINLYEEVHKMILPWPYPAKQKIMKKRLREILEELDFCNIKISQCSNDKWVYHVNFIKSPNFVFE